jgi:hypothetical protein
VRTASKRETRSAEEFDGSGVDEAEVHDGVARAVLHGDGDFAGEQGFEFGFEFLPGGVFRFGTGKGVEAEGFDAMDELARVA